MRPLSYTRASEVDEAIAIVSADPASAFLAGATTEVDLVRLGVAQPDLLVDITELRSPRSRSCRPAGCGSAPWRA
jgi:xanthine dehydrogenase YagS FAD-binding subunit